MAGAGDGAVVLPSRLAVDIVRSLEPGAVTVEVDRGRRGRASPRAARSSACGRCRRRSSPGSSPPAGEPVTLEAAALAGALRQVVRAASTDNDRPVLTGVLMAATETGLRLVATDSYRLAVRDLAGSVGARRRPEGAAAVAGAGRAPAAALGGRRGGGAAAGRARGHFDVGPTRLTTRLIEGEYPNYANLIPKGYPNRLVVGKDAMLDAVRRVRLMTRDATTPVRLSLRPDGLELTAITPDLGQATEDVDAKYEGAELTWRSTPRTSPTGSRRPTGDEVTLETQDAGKPAMHARHRELGLPVPAHAGRVS